MSTKLLSGSASEIVPANAQRRSIAILNEDDAIGVYIKREAGQSLTVSSTDHDWFLGPRAAIAFNSEVDGEQAIRARYTGIAASGTPRIAFIESEDLVR